jgi:hypothetical protein
MQTPCARHSGIRGSVSIAPFFLNIGTTWSCVVNVTPWQLYRREILGTNCVGGSLRPRLGLDFSEDRLAFFPAGNGATVLRLYIPQAFRIPTSQSRPKTTMTTTMTSIAKEAMYALRNIEVFSCIHCCSGTAISITYS